MISKTNWNGSTYDHSLHFVSKYGQELFSLLEPGEGESILDLGCGTGDLAGQMATLGANVTGVDASLDMLARARGKYRDVQFIHCDAHQYKTYGTYDKILSNAEIHWMKDIKKVMRNMHHSLKKDGILVCEFGASGNMHHIIQAYTEILNQKGEDITLRNPWTFLDEQTFVTMLEEIGFTIQSASTFDRMTPLDGKNGLKDWLHSFHHIFMSDFEEQEREEAYKRIMDETKNELWINGTWHVDYKRLRVCARK